MRGGGRAARHFPVEEDQAGSSPVHRAIFEAQFDWGTEDGPSGRFNSGEPCHGVKLDRRTEGGLSSRKDQFNSDWPYQDLGL